MFVRQFNGTITKNVNINAMIEDKFASNNPALFVYLHASGEREASEYQKIHLLADTIPKKIKKNFNCIYAYPFCPPDSVWNPDDIAFCIEKLCQNYNINKARIYLGGHSMGARGTWFTACHYPDLFAAILPVSGFSYYLMASRISHLPVWCIHGNEDRAVPKEESIRMIQELRSYGNKRAKISLLPGFDHMLTARAFESKDVFEWLFSHENTRIKLG